MAQMIPSARSTHVCMLCLTDEGPLHPIFGGGIADLAEKIYDISSLELADITGIPSLICELCRSQVLVSHQFVLQCRVSVWRFRKLVVAAPPVRQDVKVPRLSIDSSSSGIGELTADDSGTSAKVPTKPVAQHDLLRRLKHDDKAARRHSVDQVRKTDSPKKPPKQRRLSDSSQHNPLEVTIKTEPKDDDDDREGKDNRKKQCTKCGRRVIHLGKHMNVVHAAVQKHACELCGRSFCRPRSLTDHLNTHNGLQPYGCEQCGKRYSNRGSLYQHERTHEIKYHCELCNEGFTHKGLLKLHMTTHADSK
ncbi:zinc finger protein 90-like [Culex pipiens pallens]|uniref:zinc finger protein 90-like n=1 Tax=Culex pipiens pallens TaxID=42434 RepID=UPI001954423E|nr:zinc finger protein 90-like [Culex pipiens pallens]